MSLLRVVPLEEVPIESIVRLLQDVLGEGPLGRTPEVFRWKHREGPFGPSWGLGALDPEGDLIAVRLFQRWRFGTGQQRLEAARAVDTATHPAWRRQGLFRRLTQALLEQVRVENVHLVFNTPNERSRPGYLDMGWRSVGRVPILVRPLRPLRAAGRWVWSATPEPARTPPPELPSNCRPIDELLEESALNRFLEDLWAGEERLHSVRSCEYLRWRYAALPRGASGGLPRYGALWDFSADSGAIVIVRVRSRRGLREVSICEVLIRGERTGSERATDLIQSIAGHSEADYLVAVAAPGSPERRSLRRASFLPAGRWGPHLTVRELNSYGAGPQPARWRSWRLSLGDLELF